jgi:hypothetical protein
MAATKDNTRVKSLRNRVKRHQHELLQTDRNPVSYSILDPAVRRLTAVICGSLDDVEAWCDAYDDPDVLSPLAGKQISLAHRVAALGPYELLVTNDGQQLVLEKAANDGPIEVVFRHRNDGDDDLKHWLETRQAGRVDTAAAPRSEKPSVLTHGNVMRAYALVSAARALLAERRDADPNAAASGSEIAIELLSVTEDVLVGNPGGTPDGQGFDTRGAA